MQTAPGTMKGREGGHGCPWLPCPARPAHLTRAALHPRMPHAPSVPLTVAPRDPNGFHRGPNPQSGARGQGGTRPPHRCPPLRSHHVSVPVCVPASSLPLLSAASLLVALSTLQPLHSCPTNLSRPLSLPPCLLPPICSSQGRPWARPGPLSLCPRLSVSLCPVTSGSFSGADHLFPGCLAAVLMLWCGQNNSDFLMPSAVNFGSLLLSHSIFNLTLPLQLFQSPLPPRACLREHVSVSVCACVCGACMRACALLWPASGRVPRTPRLGWGGFRVVWTRPGSHSSCTVRLSPVASVPETAAC